MVSQKNEDELDIVAAVVWYNPTIKSIDNIKGSSGIPVGKKCRCPL